MDILLNQQTTSSQLQQTQRWLVTANQLLALASDDLSTRLQEEVASNPALELEELPICPRCGRALQGMRCEQCQAQATGAEVDASDALSQEGYWLSPGAERADEWDPLAQYAAPLDLKDALTQALQIELLQEATPIIEYLVGNLDEDGYLRCTVEEAASVLQVPLAQVEQVLTHLQAQEPSGIGARTLQECLLLQLRALAAEGRSCPYAAEIVAHWFEPLARRKYAVIARELDIRRRQVEQVVDFLKRHLTPFPARGSVQERGGSDRGRETLVPQVIIRRQTTSQGNYYTVEVVEAERFHLRVNPLYLEVSREVRHQPDRFSLADRTHLQQQVGAARLILISLHKRWQTLGRITQYLAAYQQDFLEQGNTALRPLTRAQVAHALEVHPSTVSRATADKWVLLPDGQVVPLSRFFEANLPIKDALKNVLAQETTPLSDQRLTEMLAARGLQVARRTIAKYREELRIPAHASR